ncbi:hypothetical protein HME9304_00643 [Flagellimonas maritima]|uniref:Uncharacterized protein n=1 Tax=Flagellimonas maritima TaxID=1383885 RepID=A0A2Z4LPE2_9FLAO|nr:hypothetical protein HME9304_00643 [Allomuricauda aurantiaca]
MDILLYSNLTKVSGTQFHIVPDAVLREVPMQMMHGFNMTDDWLDCRPAPEEHPCLAFVILRFILDISIGNRDLNLSHLFSGL